MAAALSEGDLSTLTDATFLDALINTKIPQIFAASAVEGDGTDWNLTELGILGDISISVPVTIFDNGNHQSPVPHVKPLASTLIFTPSALLRNGRGHTPADWAEVVTFGDILSRLDSAHKAGSLSFLHLFKVRKTIVNLKPRTCHWAILFLPFRES